MGNSSVEFKGTALITGASSGIGYEMTELFAREGFNLVLVARNSLRLEKIADDLRRRFNIRVTVVPKDLSEQNAANDLYCELQRQNIAVNILVNNAGFNVYGPFPETSMHSESQMMQLNMVTLTQLTKLLLPAMLKRKSGKILNVASTAAFTPGPGSAVYCASKAYVLSFSEALAEELKGTGVRVTALCPGPTKTEFAERAQMTDSRLFRGSVSSADDVARDGYQALMRGDTMAISGAANKLLVFSLRFSPRAVVPKVAKKLLAKSDNTGTSAINATR
jgi:short-subunit dehydrogenase